MKILITGGAGFIGSHIAELALSGGLQVAVLDNLSTGQRRNLPKEVTFFLGDVRSRSDVERALDTFRPDVVSHQAAQVSVSSSMREPVGDAESNVLGTLTLLETCKNASVQRFVYASTGGAIYGEVPEGLAATESFPACPISPYGASKFAGEHYLAVYAATYGIDTFVLRYANVYGPRQNAHGEAGVVAIFSERIAAHSGIQVNARHASGDDGCIRDYVYVRDVARANIAAALGALDVRLLNVGSGVATSTLTLARSTMMALSTEVSIRYCPPRDGDVKRSLLDVTALKLRLGEPTSLLHGLRETAAWYADHAQPDMTPDPASNHDAATRKVRPALS